TFPQNRNGARLRFCGNVAGTRSARLLLPACFRGQLSCGRLRGPRAPGRECAEHGGHQGESTGEGKERAGIRLPADIRGRVSEISIPIQNDAHGAPTSPRPTSPRALSRIRLGRSFSATLPRGIAQGEQGQREGGADRGQTTSAAMP
ncbi:MAG: hypothetical protein JWP66_18, partial [Naasia sp.]|nr:hypothetical protein [Naasia sp.]